MTGVLFLSQSQLDTWLNAGLVELAQDTLTVTADNASFPVVPAVHVKAVVDGTDSAKLVGKVKAVEALRMGGAEISLGAVVLGDSAYEVDDGFMVTLQLPDRPSPRPPSKPAPTAKGGEADLLAQFILNKLS